MGEIVSITIGWALKKSFDFVWELAVKLWLLMWQRCPFVVVRRTELLDLRHKARCLSVLQQAYDELPELRGEVSGVREVVSWRH